MPSANKVMRLNRLIFIVIVSLSLLSPVVAGDNGRKVFTNQDLDKYKRHTDIKSPPNAGQAYSFSGFEEDYSGLEETERNLKRYVIPYAGTARRIIIPVTFNRRVTAPMLLDTGAPGMHISVRLAKRLGILENDDAKLLVSVGGLGGTTPAIFTIIDSIQVGDAEDKFIPTYISPLMFKKFDGLVGMDFMGKYSVEIDSKKKQVIFEELPDSADLPAGHDESWWRTTFNNFRQMRSAWENYRDSQRSKGGYTEKDRKMTELAEQQYETAEDLYDRLNVYASEHSVPLEWR